MNPPPPVTGTEALLIVENAFNCNGSPYGFNCQVSRGAPKIWPKDRTPARVTFNSQFACIPFVSHYFPFVSHRFGAFRARTLRAWAFSCNDQGIVTEQLCNDAEIMADPCDPSIPPEEFLGPSGPKLKT